MSFDGHLIHTCVIERDPKNGEDLRGNAPVDQSPELIYEGICRLVEKSEKIDRDVGGGTVITVYKLYVPTGAQFSEHDRVKEIVLEDGSKLENAYTIKETLSRRGRQASFLSISLERVQ